MCVTRQKIFYIAREGLTIKKSGTLKSFDLKLFYIYSYNSNGKLLLRIILNKSQQWRKSLRKV